jgi:thioredoxin 1
MKRYTTALALILTLAGLAYAELPSATEATVKSALSSGKPVVIELGARTCPSCKKMAPIIESLADEFRGKAAVLFIDVIKDSAAEDNFRVQMIPTQIFFNAQGKEVKRHMGFLDKAAIIKEMKAAGLQ